MEFEKITKKNDINRVLQITEEPKPNISLYIKDLSLVDLDDIEEISKKVNIEKILVPIDENNIGNADYNTYTLKEYKEIRKKINDIIQDIDETSQEIEKFLKIYQSIGENISYSNEDYYNWQERTQEQKKSIIL